MNSIAIIQTYYDDPNYLQQAIKTWNTYEIPISIILIDDGSPQYPASEVLSQFTISNNVNVSLYKVTEDIGFNSHHRLTLLLHSNCAMVLIALYRW